jgi:hypothetical protein
MPLRLLPSMHMLSNLSALFFTERADKLLNMFVCVYHVDVCDRHTHVTRAAAPPTPSSFPLCITVITTRESTSLLCCAGSTAELVRNVTEEANSVYKKKPLDPETLKERLAKGQLLKERLLARRRDPSIPLPLRGVSSSLRARREIRRSLHKNNRIEEVMQKNLAQGKWLGKFKPLNMACPLLGRRVSVDAVSEWASKAWDCDGLGYAWKCIQQSQKKVS